MCGHSLIHTAGSRLCILIVIQTDLMLPFSSLFGGTSQSLRLIFSPFSAFTGHLESFVLLQVTVEDSLWQSVLAHMHT